MKKLIDFIPFLNRNKKENPPSLEEIFKATGGSIENINYFKNKITFIFEDGHTVEVTPVTETDWEAPFMSIPEAYVAGVHAILIATSNNAIKKLQEEVNELKAEIAHLEEKQ